MTSILTQSKSKILVIVPCSKKKVWDKFPNSGSVYAKDAYVSSYFKLCRKYAEKFGNSWVILSAKYGFIRPDFVIPTNYDVSFNNSKGKVVSTQKLKEQARGLRFQRYKSIIVLGGKQYVQISKNVLEGYGVQIIVPLESLGIGKRQAKIKKALAKGIPLI